MRRPFENDARTLVPRGTSAGLLNLHNLNGAEDAYRCDSIQILRLMDYSGRQNV